VGAAAATRAPLVCAGNIGSGDSTIFDDGVATTVATTLELADLFGWQPPMAMSAAIERNPSALRMIYPI
jgi:hypothetical protein